MKTQNEIQAQIDKLNAVMRKLPAMNAAGDSYPEALGAMVEVLQHNISEDDIPVKYLKAEPNASDYIMNCAFQSRDWLDGRRDEDLDMEFLEILQSYGL